MDDLIRVEGLGEMRRALRSMGDTENLGEVRNALRAAAAVVAQDAASRVPSLSGRAASTIRPLVSGNKAFVAGGKASLPYYGWLDFGTRNPVRGNPRSRGPWAGSGKGPRKGRFIYPAIDAKSKEIADLVGDGLDRISRKAGLR